LDYVMKAPLLFVVLCLGTLGACRPGRASTPLPQPATETAVQERLLIAQLAALYPAEAGAIIRRAFDDPFMVGTKAPQNAEAQNIIDRIDAIRYVRRDSLAKAAALKTARQPMAFGATVVLLPRLADSTASAEIWRRAILIPHDVIALPADHATVGALGAALQMLMQHRHVDGDSAIADAHFVVYGAHVPENWRGGDIDMSAVATVDLDKLRASAATLVPGFGRVRSRVVFLRPSGSR
jgi:hypothetical protein